MMNIIYKALAQTNGSEVAGTVAKSFDFDLANIFGWAIGVGAILAFGVIIFGGVLWSTSEIVNKKADAIEWIKGGVYGLLLLIISWLILNTINPEILQF